MNPLRLFALDILDARLVPESEEKINQTKRKAPPSRWNTMEFYFYYVVFIVCVPLMFWGAMSGSNGENSNSFYLDPLHFR